MLSARVCDSSCAKSRRPSCARSLRHDLVRFVRAEADSKVGFLPRRFEVGFGTDRSAPELQRGLELGDGLFMSGKIDRIDIDPMSARGIVQDYKSGKGSFSARQIDEERRLQVPLYMLVLRDLGGNRAARRPLPRALGRPRRRVGCSAPSRATTSRATSRPTTSTRTSSGEQVEAAREHGLGAARRIRTGDVAHDPKGGECPTWCDLWTMCRVARQS